jgi:hypothetical protein
MIRASGSMPHMLYSEHNKQKPAFLHKPIKNIFLTHLKRGREEQENRESNGVT